MTAFIFPGQGAQFEGMGKAWYEENPTAKTMFEQANDILGFRLSDVMFEGTAEELKETNITQPAIFLHSMIALATAQENTEPKAVAGHSLGEFSALVAAKAMSFENALLLVHQRATEMQKACKLTESTMAAILGLEDDVVVEVCNGITDEIVVAANFNCPGQLVISGSIPGIEKAVELLKEKGARKAAILAVGGAFHSPLMEPAREKLAEAIMKTTFSAPICPVYQNVDAKAETDPAAIQTKLIQQLTAPVKWTQTIQQMKADGLEKFFEVGGNGKVLRALLRRIDRSLEASVLA